MLQSRGPIVSNYYMSPLDNFLWKLEIEACHLEKKSPASKNSSLVVGFPFGALESRLELNCALISRHFQSTASLSASFWKMEAVYNLVVIGQYLDIASGSHQSRLIVSLALFEPLNFETIMAQVLHMLRRPCSSRS